MWPSLPLLRLRRLNFLVTGSLLVILTVCLFAACRPYRMQPAPHTVHLSPADSLLAGQFPLPGHLIAQKELLLKYSKPTQRVLKPDGELQEGHFNSGAIDLIFDKVRGEPGYLIGHLQESPNEELSFVIFGIPDKQLDRLVPGQHCLVRWIETVVFTKYFDDDRYRLFLTYKVEGI